MKQHQLVTKTLQDQIKQVRDSLALLFILSFGVNSHGTEANFAVARLYTADYGTWLKRDTVCGEQHQV